MKLSLAITTHNRPEMTIKAFEKVIDHPKISEIVIVDDCSDIDMFAELNDKIKKIDFNWMKVTIVRNSKNIGMSRNKEKAIRLCANDYVIIFDSDNVLEHKYIDAFYESIKEFMPEETIFLPDFAKPQFDYRDFDYTYFDKNNICKLMDLKDFDVMLNTCNYIVPRELYSKVYKYDKNIKASDTIYFAYLWLKAGYGFMVVPGMEYFHTVHDDSGFLQDVDYNMKMAAEFKKKIRNL